MLKFGTDGVRGVANVELTPELALALGRAAVRVLGGDRFAVGRDTRGPGRCSRPPLAAGLASEGADVTVLGVVPTPEVAWWSATEGAPAAMVSASHNPFADNGIKLFSGRRPQAGRRRRAAPRGRAAAAARRGGVDRAASGAGGPERAARRGGRGRIAPAPATAGPRGLRRRGDRVDRRPSPRRAPRRRRLRQRRRLGGGAPGAARPRRRRARAARRPDGTNINDGCGSTHPDALAGAVVEHGADLGVAFDGDADRVLLVDAAGEAGRRRPDHRPLRASTGTPAARLPGDTVVVTVMTNLGFRLAMAEHGIAVVETAVGDRYVLEALEAKGPRPRRRAERARDLPRPRHHRRRAAHRRAGARRRGPIRPTRWPSWPAVDDPVAPGAAQRAGGPARSRRRRAPRRRHRRRRGRLGEVGRVLVRPSGTEPLVRVMAEAPTEAEAEAAVGRRWSRAVEALATG